LIALISSIFGWSLILFNNSLLLFSFNRLISNSNLFSNDILSSHDLINDLWVLYNSVNLFSFLDVSSSFSVSNLFFTTSFTLFLFSYNLFNFDFSYSTLLVCSYSAKDNALIIDSSLDGLTTYDLTKCKGLLWIVLSLLLGD